MRLRELVRKSICLPAKLPNLNPLWDDVHGKEPYKKAPPKISPNSNRTVFDRSCCWRRKKRDIERKAINNLVSRFVAFIETYFLLIIFTRVSQALTIRWERRFSFSLDARVDLLLRSRNLFLTPHSRSFRIWIVLCAAAVTDSVWFSGRWKRLKVKSTAITIKSWWCSNLYNFNQNTAPSSLWILRVRAAMIWGTLDFNL